VAAAKERTLSVIDARGLAPAEGRRLAEASEDASVATFRVAMGISAGLVGLGGVIGAAGIVNRRRPVRAGDCPGGQLTGAPLEAARLPARGGDTAPAAA
jgi:hypothetical protein